MNRTLANGTLVTLAASALLVSSGCMVPGGSVDLTDLVTESRAVELGEAETVEVFLDTSIGDFEVRGGASGLMEADFTYNIAEWKPTVEYKESGTRGVLTIRQPDLNSKNVPNGAKNRWDVRLAAGVPMSIYLDSAVGDVRMDLEGISIERLDVDQGVGSIEIDLGSDVERDADLNVDGGIGEIVLTLPEGVGVEVDADMGLGSFTAPGLTKRNGRYVSPEYGDAEVNIRIRVDAGIGSVTVRTGDTGRAAV
ncbi:MAG: toast rack family protein [Candidatus Eisenbacteria bacterium]